jgi:hypothetical protein
MEDNNLIELSDDQIVVENNVTPVRVSSQPKKVEPAGEDTGGESSENDG